MLAFHAHVVSWLTDNTSRKTDNFPPDSQITNPEGRVILGHLENDSLNLQLGRLSILIKAMPHDLASIYHSLLYLLDIDANSIRLSQTTLLPQTSAFEMAKFKSQYPMFPLVKTTSSFVSSMRHFAGSGLKFFCSDG